MVHVYVLYNVCTQGQDKAWGKDIIDKVTRQFFFFLFLH